MPKNESHFFVAMDVEDTKTPWPDVKEKWAMRKHADTRILSIDKDNHNVTKLQIYQPGWKQGHGTYTHPYWEEIFVVSGRIYDHTIKRWVGAGEYACRPPGQRHGPFECSPEEGATVLLINTASWAK